MVSGLARYLIAVAVFPEKVSGLARYLIAVAVLPAKVSAIKWLHSPNLSIIIQKIALIFQKRFQL